MKIIVMKGMRALTPVIAVVIMIGIAIGLSATFWVYLSDYTSSSVGNHIELVNTFCAGTDLAMVTIRNVGTDAINTDEIEVFDKRSGKDITSQIWWSSGEPERGKILWLRFNERSGGVTYDSSRYNRTVNLVNSPGWSTDSISGKSSMMFDGATDFAEVPSFPGLLEGSVAFWLSWANSTGHGVTHGDSWAIGSLSWVILLDAVNESLTMRLFNPGTGVPACDALSPRFTFPPNQWFHVVGAWNTTSCMLFKNGEMIKYTKNTTRYHTGNYKLRVASSPQPLHVGGKYDDFRIYDRVLEPEEIMVLAQKDANIMLPGERKTMMHICESKRCEYRIIKGLGIGSATVLC